ncbi:E3 ubiquitin protein ligase MARCH8, partial [Tanacetum coccineum]
MTNDISKETLNNQETSLVNTTFDEITTVTNHQVHCSISVVDEHTPLNPSTDDDDDDEDDINDENTSLVNATTSDQQPQCRICLDTEGEDLIAPCHCRGTQKYVHRSCLDNWRSTREGFAFSHCTECRAVFILRANVPPDRWWLRFKFQLLVARDHAFIFVIVQLIVAFL